jgi:hypothetical protein
MSLINRGEKKPWRDDDRLELWRGWADQIQMYGEKLSVWEEEFVESVVSQLDQGRGLSERQAEILERIYSEKTP